jgi:integrase
MHIPAPVPDFVRNDFMLLSDFRKVEGKFHALLKSGNAADHTYSLFVCSVVIFGGVTSVPLLDAILRTSMRRVHFHAGDVFVALEISLGQGELDFGTWFPDRLTTALMLRWLTSAKERSKAQSVAPASAITADKTTDGTTQRQRVSQAVQEAFSLLNLPSMPWQDFLHAAHVATALQVSPFLAHYLHGTFVSRSMHPTVYQRLNGWVAEHAYQIQDRAKLQEFAQDPSLSDECLQATPLPFDPLKSPENQLRFIRDITSILGTTVHSDVAKKLLNQRIVKSQGSLWPITEMLAKWASWRLGRPDDIGQVKPHTKRLAPSSALRYLNAIGRHLITEVGPEDVTDLDAEDFETAYEEAGSHVTTLKERAVYWMCVTAFHRYLTFCGAPHIDMEELDGYEGASVGSVAANVVSEREFQYFKREVWDTGTPEPDSPRLLWLLIAVLGFRCGLRRTEIQMLGMHDFHPGEFPVLIVRASRLATLKSKSSHRRIPLWALLAKDELEWIKQYWSVRSGDAFTANGLLFSGASDPHVPLDSSWLFDPITRAFGRIVGDVGPQFRFHCLRHSFANWTLIKLVVADHPDWIAHMPTDCVMDPAVYAKKAQELKMAAFPKLPEMQEAPSRRYLYLVSALLGHLSPNTTVRHYISLLGWLARLELNSALSCRLKHWTHAELAHACGLSLSATTKAPYRGWCDIPLDFFGKFAAVHIPQSRHSAPALPSNLVDLSAAFTREFAPRVHSPSQLLVLLNLRIRLQEQLQYLQDSNLMSVTREAILTKMGQRHGVAPQSLEQAYAAYQKMYSSRC